MDKTNRCDDPCDAIEFLQVLPAIYQVLLTQKQSSKASSSYNSKAQKSLQVATTQTTNAINSVVQVIDDSDDNQKALLTDILHSQERIERELKKNSQTKQAASQPVVVIEQTQETSNNHHEKIVSAVEKAAKHSLVENKSSTQKNDARKAVVIIDKQQSSHAEKESTQEAVRETAKNLDKTIAEVDSTQQSEQKNNRNNHSNQAAIKSTQAEANIKSGQPTRGPDGRFLPKSAQASKERREEKQHTSLIAAIKANGFSKILSDSFLYSDSAEAGAAVGGVYGGAAMEVLRASEEMQGAFAVLRPKKKDKKTKENEHTSNPLRGLVGKGRLFKRQEIKAHKASIQNQKNTTQVNETLNAESEQETKRHKEVVDLLKGIIKSNDKSLLEKLAGLASGLGMLGGLRGARNSNAGRGRAGQNRSSSSVLNRSKDSKNTSDRNHKDNKSSTSIRTNQNEKVAQQSNKHDSFTKKISGIKGLGAISALLGLVSLASIETDSSLTREEKNVEHGGNIGRSAGALAGAASGAAIGSLIFPGVGTVVGGLIGGFAVDYFAGNASESLGRETASWLNTNDWSAIPATIDAKVGEWLSAFQATEIGKTITGAWESLTASISESWDISVKSLEAIWGNLKEDLTGALKTANSAIEEVTGINVQKTANEAIDAVSDVAKDASKAVESIIDKVAETEAGQAIASASSSVGGWISSAWGATTSKVESWMPSSSATASDSQEQKENTYTQRNHRKMSSTANRTKTQRWNSVKGELIGAANTVGVDAGTLAAITHFESKFNSHARPVAGRKRAHLNTVRQFDGKMAMSSAHGYGQFIDATWTRMLNTYGRKYGVTNAGKLTKKQANKYRTNTKLQAAMLAEFTKENVALGRKLGGKDEVANVYALHNLGGGDGGKFLKALRSNPNQSVANVLSSNVISRNSSLYGNGSISVQEAYARMGDKMREGQVYVEQARELQKQSKQTARSQSKVETSNSTTTANTNNNHSETATQVVTENRSIEQKPVVTQANAVAYPRDEASTVAQATHTATATVKARQVNPPSVPSISTPVSLSPPNQVLPAKQQSTPNPYVTQQATSSNTMQTASLSKAIEQGMKSALQAQEKQKAMQQKSKEQNGLEQGKNNEIASHIPIDFEDAYWLRMTHNQQSDLMV